VNHPEYAIQFALVGWCDVISCAYPDVGRYIATDPAGARTPQAGLRRKRMGVRAGVPDIMWPAARHGFHGLWIELKADKGRLSPAQTDWLSYLATAGHLAVCCHGLTEAIDAVAGYFDVKVAR